jgi:phosphoribosylformimino-5-aminoimidazole carboxamide ribotide isomerase
MGFEILPAIDLRGGRVVRLRQGDFARETVYSDEPAVVAEAFAGAGARWLHVVDLDGARSGIPAHGAAVAAIIAAVGERLSVDVAGGLRDAASVAAVLTAGATRAIIGTAALADPSFAGRLIATHGADRIVVAVDVRDGRAVGHGWTPGSGGVDAAAAIGRLADAGVETFEVTAIERDGLLEGPNLELYERLVRLSRGSIIASGGVSTLDDLRAVRRIGCAGAIIGRALYEGRIGLRQALGTASEPN